MIERTREIRTLKQLLKRHPVVGIVAARHGASYRLKNKLKNKNP